MLLKFPVLGFYGSVKVLKTPLNREEETTYPETGEESSGIRPRDDAKRGEKVGCESQLIFLRRCDRHFWLQLLWWLVHQCLKALYVARRFKKAVRDKMRHEERASEFTSFFNIRIMNGSVSSIGTVK